MCASETPCQSEKATTNVVHTKRAIYKNQKKTSEWLNVNDIWYSFRQKKIYLHTFFKSNVSHEHHFSVGIMPLIPNKYEQIKLVFCFIQWTSVHYSQCQRAIERDPIDNDNKLTNNNRFAKFENIIFQTNLQSLLSVFCSLVKWISVQYVPALLIPI